MKTIWTQHLSDPEKRKEFEKLLLNSTLSLGRLYDIIEMMMNEIYTKEEREEAYQTPNWAYLQAHANGRLQAYGNMLRLLDFAKDPKRNGPAQRRKSL